MNPSKARKNVHKGVYTAQPWSEIYSRLSVGYQQDQLSAEELYTLALAAYLTGKDPESTDILARAHDQYLVENNPLPAVRAAFWLGMLCMFRGERARGSGWFSRARHQLQDISGETAEKALLSIPQALQFLQSGEAHKAYETFAAAAKSGDAFNDPDLSTLALLGCGQSLIGLGKYPEGLAVLDEAMLAVEADSISPIVVGVVYCAVIETCLMSFDIQRAQEWTRVLSQWCDAQPELVPFRGQCLIRRAQILHLHGDWPEALAEMQRACDLLSQPPGEPAAGEACYQLADFYRLRGDYPQAEKLFEEASQWGRNPQPGCALLRLAQKQPEAALASVQSSLEEAPGPLQRLGILPAYIEIMLAGGRLQQARQAATEFTSLTESYQAPFVQAVSALSRGLVLLEEGQSPEALQLLRYAAGVWMELHMPYHAARVRLRIGLAYRAQGDEEAAQRELSAARWVFQQLDAQADLSSTEGLLHQPPPQSHGGLSLREVQVLGLVAEGEANKAIATTLFISEKTVERHLSNIFAKLGVKSRTAATAYAHRHKLLE
jgi:DNA-binding CsgD family transcriptional regulator